MEWPRSETQIRSSYASPGPTAQCWLLQHFVKHVDQRFIIFNLFQTKRQIQQNVTGETLNDTWSSQNFRKWHRGNLKENMHSTTKVNLGDAMGSNCRTFLDFVKCGTFCSKWWDYVQAVGMGDHFSAHFLPSAATLSKGHYSSEACVFFASLSHSVRYQSFV